MGTAEFCVAGGGFANVACFVIMDGVIVRVLGSLIE